MTKKIHGEDEHDPRTAVTASFTSSSASATTSTAAATTAAAPRVKKNAFVSKLFTMLSDPNLNSLIWWSTNNPEQNTFSLYPGKEFAHCLTRYFKHGNVASFVRQLHMYGFHKVSDSNNSNNNANNPHNHGPGLNDPYGQAIDPSDPTAYLDKDVPPIWEFKHSSGKFKKDDESSLIYIKRRSSSHSSSRNNSYPSDKPTSSSFSRNNSHSQSQQQVPQLQYGVQEYPQQYPPSNGYPQPQLFGYMDSHAQQAFHYQQHQAQPPHHQLQYGHQPASQPQPQHRHQSQPQLQPQTSSQSQPQPIPFGQGLPIYNQPYVYQEENKQQHLGYPNHQHPLSYLQHQPEQFAHFPPHFRGSYPLEQSHDRLQNPQRTNSEPQHRLSSYPQHASQPQFYQVQRPHVNSPMGMIQNQSQSQSRSQQPSQMTSSSSLASTSFPHTSRNTPSDASPKKMSILRGSSIVEPETTRKKSPLSSSGFQFRKVWDQGGARPRNPSVLFDPLAPASQVAASSRGTPSPKPAMSQDASAISPVSKLSQLLRPPPSTIHRPSSATTISSSLSSQSTILASPPPAPAGAGTGTATTAATYSHFHPPLPGLGLDSRQSSIVAPIPQHRIRSSVSQRSAESNSLPPVSASAPITYLPSMNPSSQETTTATSAKSTTSRSSSPLQSNVVKKSSIQSIHERLRPSVFELHSGGSKYSPTTHIGYARGSSNSSSSGVAGGIGGIGGGTGIGAAAVGGVVGAGAGAAGAGGAGSAVGSGGYNGSLGNIAFATASNSIASQSSHGSIFSSAKSSISSFHSNSLSSARNSSFGSIAFSSNSSFSLGPLEHLSSKQIGGSMEDVSGTPSQSPTRTHPIPEHSSNLNRHVQSTQRPKTPNQNRPNSPFGHLARSSSGPIPASLSMLTSGNNNRPNKKVSVTSLLDDSQANAGLEEKNNKSKKKREDDEAATSAAAAAGAAPGVATPQQTHLAPQRPLYLSSSIREERSSQSSNESGVETDVPEQKGDANEEDMSEEDANKRRKIE
ncbi:uncharacterized protein LODBEIA_P54300 [Lodderomyces beijingensis]|uniref:HSF-type DNA-binding domain-containing protein n=1 Tax=Lodderomyces beijingensis TaxID=1775926 RepID=A0ABP0ZVK2_9ASCO